METQCPECSAVFFVPDVYQGQTIKCTTCKKPLTATAFREKIIVTPPRESKPKSEPSPIKCPKCGSTQIMGNKRGFSGGKAVGGALILGPLGLLAGLHGSKKIVVTCLNCGHKWEPQIDKK